MNKKYFSVVNISEHWSDSKQIRIIYHQLVLWSGCNAWSCICKHAIPFKFHHASRGHSIYEADSEFEFNPPRPGFNVSELLILQLWDGKPLEMAGKHLFILHIYYLMSSHGMGPVCPVLSSLPDIFRFLHQQDSTHNDPSKIHVSCWTPYVWNT